MLTADGTPGTAAGVGRPKINHDAIPGRFPEGTKARIDAVRRAGEGQSDFLREAVERELERREREAKRKS